MMNVSLFLLVCLFYFISAAWNSAHRDRDIHSIKDAAEYLQRRRVAEIEERENEQEIIDNTEFSVGAEEVSGLFEGDILATKDDVAKRYGEEVANITDVAGLFNKTKHFDMIRKKSKDQNNRNLALISNYERLWKVRDSNNKVILPYSYVDTISLDRRKTIEVAMKEIEDKTGVVKFRVRSDDDPDFLIIQNADAGCYSYVGRQGGGQVVNLDATCSLGNIIHEFFHSLGFWHEQSRADRDNYVTILYDNVLAGREHNFNKEVTNSLGLDYEYASIMHYGPTSFGKPIYRCIPTEAKANTVALIHFQRIDVEANTDFCLNVLNGDVLLRDKQPVNLTPCGESSYKNQYWIIESFGTEDNILRFALDPTYCLTANYVPYTVEGTVLVMRKCFEGTFTYQKFIFQQSTWTGVVFRWEGNASFSMSRRKNSSSTLTYPMELTTAGIDSSVNQKFKIEFLSKLTGRSATVNSFCSFTSVYADTIDSKGYYIGNRVLNTQDIDQLQLLYKCPSGPRNVNMFCSTDCKCKLHQGRCTSDDQCEEGLMCGYDGEPYNRCIVATLAPSPSPSRPTRSPTSKPTISPSNPTSSPTMLCGYNDSLSCNADRNCSWKKIGNAYKCSQFFCSNIKSVVVCRRTVKKCYWDARARKCFQKAK